MFIGREREIKEIRKKLDSKKKETVLIYGKRRIGKSFLINEILKSYSCHSIYYECLNASFEENILNFEKRIIDEYDNRYIHFESFQDAFDYLKNTNEKVIVVMDEYSYLKRSRESKYVDSVFQNIIDNMGDNIRLVLLGSYVSVMQELLEEDDPLFGRFSLILHLKEFDYYTSSLFYKDKTVREKIENYAVFGGSPYTNAYLDTDEDLRTNIINLLLNPNSAVRSYLENVLLSELSKTGPANMILHSLSNGKKKYTEISEQTRINTAGVLDKQLKNLIRMDIIEKCSPINKADDRKKVYYEISDNLVRFYYAYIYNQKDIIRRIGEEAFYELYILPTLNTFISHRFEGICKEYFQRMAKEKQFSNVYDIGTYWYDDPIRHENGEFDCVLKHKKSYSFYEVKYYKEPISIDICQKEAEEVYNLADEFSIEKIGFICSSGFDFKSDEYDLITGEELYI